MKPSTNKEKIKLQEECLENAKNLLTEAEYLIGQKYYARGAILAITSYEESLKASIVEAWKVKNINNKDFCKIFYKHDLKLLWKYAIIVFFENIKTGKISKETQMPPKRMIDVREIIRIRNSCLYVDFKGGTITSPKIINYRIAYKYFKIAEKQLNWS